MAVSIPGKGKFRSRPKGKACMSRKPKVDSLGFWNKGLPESQHRTKQDLIEFDRALAIDKPQFIDALHGEKHDGARTI